MKDMLKLGSEFLGRWSSNMEEQDFDDAFESTLGEFGAAFATIYRDAKKAAESQDERAT